METTTAHTTPETAAGFILAAEPAADHRPDSAAHPDAINGIAPNIPFIDFSNIRHFTPAEMKAKAKRWADQVKRAQKGKGLRTDNLPADTTEALILASKLYTPPEFVDFEPAFRKAMTD